MSENVGPYKLVDLTPARRAWLNALNLSEPAHCMYGLLEVDATEARQVIAEHKARTGETLSFTGFLVFCMARAVDEDKSVQAYLKDGKQFVIFDDVNVSLMVEPRGVGKGGLMGHVIRAANRKTFREIHDEIRAVQSAPVPPGRGMPGWFRSAMLLPWPLSGLVKSLLLMAVRHDPTIVVSMGGTVGITAVGMFGGGHGGWGLTTMPYPLNLIVGSTAWKPAVVEGRIEPRQILHLTVMFDHDVIDGAPAARFTRKLVELIEGGHGLEEYRAPTASDTEAAPHPGTAAEPTAQ